MDHHPSHSQDRTELLREKFKDDFQWHLDLPIHNPPWNDVMGRVHPI